MRDRGNVLFIILIAVVLFGALSYAVTSSNRAGSAGIQREKQILNEAEMQQYMAAIQAGRDLLSIAYGCNEIDYTPPQEWGNEDKSCHLFHPDGGKVGWRDLGLNNCDIEGITLQDLNQGEACGNVVYAGVSGGNRLYTTAADLGSLIWADAEILTSITNPSDGLQNTNAVLALSNANYPAAAACRALGEDWYLPAVQEMQMLCENRELGALEGTFQNNAQYWTSTERDHARFTRRVNFVDCSNSPNGTKGQSSPVRCVRRD